MKKYLLLFLFYSIATVGLSVSAQTDSTITVQPEGGGISKVKVIPEPKIEEKFDTIFVNTTQTLLVVFDTDVTMMDFGTTDFAGIMDGNTALIKTLKKNAQPTSVFIKYGSNFYHGTIAYKEVIPKGVLDFRKKELPQAINESRGTKPGDFESIDKQFMNRRIGYLEAAKDRIKGLAAQGDKVALAVTDIMSDDKFYYIKLFIANSSKSNYVIDFTEFTFYSTGQLGKEPHPGEIVDDSKVQSIPSKGNAHVIYVLKKFIIDSKGSLGVSVREKNGGRRLDLAVPFKELDNAKLF